MLSLENLNGKTVRIIKPEQNAMKYGFVICVDEEYYTITPLTTERDNTPHISLDKLKKIRRGRE